MLSAGKRLVTLSSRGDAGYELGGRLEARNLVERSITAPMSYIGLTDARCIAVEYDEFADDRLAMRSAYRRECPQCWACLLPRGAVLPCGCYGTSMNDAGLRCARRNVRMRPKTERVPDRCAR